MPTTPPLLTVAPDQGEHLQIAGGTYRIVVPGSRTGGAYAVIEMSVPPGSGPAPHAHPGFEESFYVLEGSVQFRSVSGSFEAGPHAFVSIPKGGGVHAFKNRSAVAAKLLCTVIPAGLDAFFVELSHFLVSAKESPLPESEMKAQLRSIADKHGQTVYGEDYFERVPAA